MKCFDLLKPCSTQLSGRLMVLVTGSGSPRVSVHTAHPGALFTRRTHYSLFLKLKFGVTAFNYFTKCNYAEPKELWLMTVYHGRDKMGGSSRDISKSTYLVFKYNSR